MRDTKQGMRRLRDHEINPFNKEHVFVFAADDPDNLTGGGASHEYDITVFGGKADTEIVLQFQHGPIKENSVNGITNEALLAVVLDRLRGFQKSRFSCRENSIAITKLEEAMMWLHKRSLDRERKGVEGTNKTRPTEGHQRDVHVCGRDDCSKHDPKVTMEQMQDVLSSTASPLELTPEGQLWDGGRHIEPDRSSVQAFQEQLWRLHQD